MLTAVEVSQQQQQQKNENTLSINPSILDLTTNNVSNELRESIEHLSQYLFEFLKQGLKPATLDSINQNISSSIFKSPPTSPTTIERNGSLLSDSTILTLSYSQYTQLWNLIEYTMNVNLNAQSQQKQQQSQRISHQFKLPKEAYLNMFQEINNYANNTNQTYLIDSGINTSQLRRKHHFMVMLKSLKFKFQLFVINLLK